MGVPVIDPTIAAFKAAEHAALNKNSYDWKPSRQWSSEAPPEHEIEAFGLFKNDYVFGERIIVEAQDSPVASLAAS